MAPDEHPFQVPHQLRDDLFERSALAIEAGLARRLVVRVDRRAQDRRLRLEVVDLVEGPQDREHEVGVVDRIGNRLRKLPPQAFEDFVIVRRHAS